ncbi:hypothetical protein F9K94_15005 [Brucella tritici]|uniref:Uncharacterized protein n=1 Tax=Brucella tritici TaxID=94626 RepID=A0A7V8B1I5_9HYPH|nr:hypothetical protein [Brucella tritici]KAB2655841.1 hypothetical protein F9K94_15005 [Brucella tritici]
MDMKTSKHVFLMVIPSLLFVFVIGFSFMLSQKSVASLVSADGQLSCTDEQFNAYNKHMLQAGEMTISRQPDSGTFLQQRKMIDAFEKLTLPKYKTIIAAAHVETAQVYTTACAKEKCTMDEMAKPEQACLTEHWNDCPYLAMQFREKRYCFLKPARE